MSVTGISDDRISRKKFEEIRVFVRDMFINGFRDRKGLMALSENKTRSTDGYKQIIKSWLHDYYTFEKSDGERYFISIDTRRCRRNPLHNVWKAKTFSGADIIMHFYILDYLESNKGLLLSKQSIFDYLQNAVAFDEDENPVTFENEAGEEVFLEDYLSDDKLNDKLREMTDLGLIVRTRTKNGFMYSFPKDFDVDQDMLDFASEIMPAGTIGSYLLDRQETESSLFEIKHNFIAHALDSEVITMLFHAISEHKEADIKVYSRQTKRYQRALVVPLMIVRNVQNGRQYLTCWSDAVMRFQNIRLDHIRIDITTKNHGEYTGAVRQDFDELKSTCLALFEHVWGISLVNYESGKPERVSFTIHVEKDTGYVARRLMREKRIGDVTDLGNGDYRFSVRLYDPDEIIPWITTFFGFITELDIENEATKARLMDNFNEMVHKHLAEEVRHA